MNADDFVITARKRSLGQGNVFTPVCCSVHSGHRSGRYASYRNAYLCCLMQLGSPRCADVNVTTLCELQLALQK